MVEVWKPAPDFEDRYEVSSLGRVAYVCGGARQLRKTKAQGQGYHMICFRKAGRVRSVRLHRLVAEAFVPNTTAARTVNHIDGDKDNNRADNLEWVSQKANNAHAIETGLLVKARGERIHTAKLTAEQVLQIRRRAASGETQQALADEFGVYRATIGHITTRRIWKHV